MNTPVAASGIEKETSPNPWVLPERGLAVYLRVPGLPEGTDLGRRL